MAERQKDRFAYVDVLKAMAVLLVLNSHFDDLYPIAALGTGGSLGNGLFFAVSGFCLWPVGKRFGPWFARRLERLYLPLLIATAITLATVKHGYLTVSNALFVFVWPTMYWFVGGIALFYLLYYLLRGVTEKKQFAVAFFLLACAYVVCYPLLDTSVWVVESGWTIDGAGLHNVLVGSFKLIYNFAMMLLGKYLRLHVEKPARTPRFYMMNACGGVITLYAVKFLMDRYPPLMHMQFLNQLSVLWFVGSMMLWGMAMERKGAFGQSGPLMRLVRRMSAMSLEAYLVQGVVIAVAKTVSFPVNILLALCLTAVCAVILHEVTMFLEKKIIWVRK